MGAPDGKAQRLAAGAIEPRWLGPSQIVYQAGQGDTRQLMIQAVDGKAIPLHTLPAGATDRQYPALIGGRSEASKCDADSFASHFAFQEI